MAWIRDVWAWFTGALSAVYEKDGLVGVAAVVLLVLLVLGSVSALLWFFGVDVAGWLG